MPRNSTRSRHSGFDSESSRARHRQRRLVFLLDSRARGNDGSEGGFTLIELLVTIIVLGIVISSLGGLYYLMQITEVQSQHYDVAVRAARTEIEDLRNNGYNSLTPGSNIDFTSSLPAALPPNKTGTVAVSQPLAELRRVDVTIAYNDYGKSETVKLSSDIGIIGLGQGQ